MMGCGVSVFSFKLHFTFINIRLEAILSNLTYKSTFFLNSEAKSELGIGAMKDWS